MLCLPSGHSPLSFHPYEHSTPLPILPCNGNSQNTPLPFLPSPILPYPTDLHIVTTSHILSNTRTETTGNTREWLLDLNLGSDATRPKRTGFRSSYLYDMPHGPTHPPPLPAHHADAVNLAKPNDWGELGSSEVSYHKHLLDWIRWRMTFCSSKGHWSRGSNGGTEVSVCAGKAELFLERGLTEHVPSRDKSHRAIWLAPTAV